MYQGQLVRKRLNQEMNLVSNHDKTQSKKLQNHKIIDQRNKGKNQAHASSDFSIERSILDGLSDLTLIISKTTQVQQSTNSNPPSEQESQSQPIFFQRIEENINFEQQQFDQMNEQLHDDRYFDNLSNDSTKLKLTYDSEKFSLHYNQTKREELFKVKIKSQIGDKEYDDCLKQLFIKKYVIEKVKTSGGQGTVFSGYQLQEELQSAKKFAIKLSPIQLNDINGSDGDSNNSIKQEFSKQKKIYENIKCFKYIIKRYEIFLVGKIMIEIMKLCTKDLYQYIKDTNEEITKDKIVSIMNQSFHCLTEIHINGIYHFDIKPQNILLKINNQGQISLKLTDFGISQTSDEKKIKIGGTTFYCSPEQLPFLCQTLDEKKYKDSGLNEKSDIYSMGLTFMVLLGFNTQDIRNIKKGKLNEIKTKKSYQDYQDLFSFIYYLMLNEKPHQRKSSYQLAFDFYKYMGNQVNFQIERERVQKLITKYKTDQLMNSKYMAFVYCFQGQIQQSKESFEECIELSKKKQN